MSIKAAKRRKEVLCRLEKAHNPITGTELADHFEVSRQVIVQDVALLRAKGQEIIATSRGYLIPGKMGMETASATIACRHSADKVRDELVTIVDHGARVIDVIVEHPIYGEQRGMLMIQCRDDVERFMDKYHQANANLLSSLTEGVHLHTIEAINEEIINRLKAVLLEKGYLL